MRNFRNQISFLLFVLICTFFWCVLHESFTWDKLLTGFILSLFVVAFYMRFLSLSHSISYQLPLLALIQYPFLLLIQIIKAGIHTSKLVLKNQTHPAIIVIPSRLNSEWHQILVANSITLTPGTVSVDVIDNHYIVLWIAPEGTSIEECYQQIAGPFEKLFMKGDSHA